MSVAVVHIIIGISLLLLPGVWLAFGVPLAGITYAARVALAGALSPIAAALEFLLLRRVGFSFGSSVWFTVAANAPAIWLLLRRFPTVRVHWKSLASFAAIYLILAGCIAAPWLQSRNWRIFRDHLWMHVGIVNQFAEGAVTPEEPELAGVNLAYPWLGHAYWAVLGWAMQEPPSQVYVWSNLLSLLWACVLFYEACRALGASDFASQVGLFWLGLGTNIIGALYWMLASFAGQNVSMPGDVRSTPWIRRLGKFELIVFALPLFSGLLLTGIETLKRRELSYLAMVAVLVAGMGLMYPLLYPAALGLCGVLSLLLLWQTLSERGSTSRLVWLLVGMCAASAAVLAYGHVVGSARSAPLLHLSGLEAFVAKSATGVAATALFLLAIAFVPYAELREKTSLLLLGGALPSLALRSLLHVGAGDNEYKFLFTAAPPLAALATLGIDRWAVRRSGRTLLVVVLAVLIPVTIPIVSNRGNPVGFPQVIEAGFYLRLGSAEPETGWVDAIRMRTPPDTVVVARRANLFLPAVTARSLWAPPQSVAFEPGYNLDPRWNLVEERGYAPSLFDEREAIIDCIYLRSDEARLRAAETALLSLGRPVAIVIEPREGQSFLALLERERRGQLLYRSVTGTSVWLLNSYPHLSQTLALEKPGPRAGHPGISRRFGIPSVIRTTLRRFMISPE